MFVEQVALNMEIFQKFLDMYARVNPDEVVVGWFVHFFFSFQVSTHLDLYPWLCMIRFTFVENSARYSTGNELRYTSSLIHLTYAEHNDIGEPLHLLVDTALSGNQLTVKGFVSQSVDALAPAAAGAPAATRRVFTKFSQVPLDIKSAKSEAVAGMWECTVKVTSGCQWLSPSIILAPSMSDDLDDSSSSVSGHADQGRA